MIYLDAAATMPLRDGVADRLSRTVQSTWGSVSGSHDIARQAKNLLEESREKLADSLGVHPGSVVFTSGATESINIAIQGFCAAHQDAALYYSAIEHSAITKTAQHLEERGRSVIQIDVDMNGIVDATQLDNISAGDLVCVMPVNNEVGVVNDVETITAVVHARGGLVLLDCVQSLYALDPRRACEIADFIVFSGHKIGSPKGVGVLVAKNRKSIVPIMYGGSQEWELRPGTTPAYLIDSFVDVFVSTSQTRVRESAYLEDLQRECIALIDSHLPSVRIHARDVKRSPHIVALDCRGIEAQMLVTMLDTQGVCVSKGSACASGAITPSHVLVAMGISDEKATSTIRLSFSHRTTKEEIREAITILQSCISQLVSDTVRV